MSNTLPNIAPKRMLLNSSFIDGEPNAANLYHSDDHFRIELSQGPEMTWIGPANTGISGPHTLKASGRIKNGGKYSKTIFHELDIPVGPDTTLKYHVFPAMHGKHYDHNYTQMYFCFDLLFADGTQLSETGACDQNGTGFTPVAQVQSRILYAKDRKSVV